MGPDLAELPLMNPFYNLVSRQLIFKHGAMIQPEQLPPIVGLISELFPASLSLVMSGRMFLTAFPTVAHLPSIREPPISPLKMQLINQPLHNLWNYHW